MKPRPPELAHVTAARDAYNADLIEEVASAVAAHDVVVVGVSGLQPGKKARKLLDAKKVPYTYLEYGSYLSGWRRRLALKMWIGWPTFPLIFVKGTFIGGGSDLKKLMEAGEFDRLLAGPRQG